MALLNKYKEFCQRLQSQGLWRVLATYSKNAIDFTHSDYLGLSEHPQITAAIKGFTGRAGARSSRLLNNDNSQYRALEKEIAATKGTEDALIFNTGYQANSTVLASLLKAQVVGEVLIFSDRQNHASLHHGCVGHQQIRYAHNDLDHLEKLLEKSAANSNKIIITEAAFSMEGTISDIDRLVKLANHYDALLYLDEAHYIGVFGYGALNPGRNVILMGTFSKALGLEGAFIAASKDICDYLINQCWGFIYSTAPSPFMIEAMMASWSLIPDLQLQRQLLFNNISIINQQLKLNSKHPIIPIIIPEIDKLLEVQATLRSKNILVSAIRPPTASPPRLRISLSALHTPQQVMELAQELNNLLPSP